ncbi:hypothetical protein SAMN04488053_102323 [Alkalicoccus daliensis]|uniref:Uncharacterized protein n=2 Tax=Alkalicoccus daliensis TaxID=745820 RepID=A0A1H0D2U0_9BACI|nr:hypothetical protein SAMN04488053_102323 [Alkalicoccus daliensis]
MLFYVFLSINYHHSSIMNFAFEQNGEVALGVPFTSSMGEESSELNRGEPFIESVSADSTEQDYPELDQEYTLTVEPYFYLEEEEPREAINEPYIEVSVIFTDE